MAIKKIVRARSSAGKKAGKKLVKKAKKVIKKKVPARSAKKTTKPIGKKPAITRKRGDSAEARKQKAESLVMKGRQRGFVTYTEILKTFPDVETDIIFLEELYGKLEDAGVDVL